MRFLTVHEREGTGLAVVYKAQEQRISESLVNNIIKAIGIEKKKKKNPRKSLESKSSRKTVQDKAQRHSHTYCMGKARQLAKKTGDQ